MTRFWLCLLLLVVPAVGWAGEPWFRSGLEETTTLSPRIELDREIHVEGKASIRITAGWPVTVMLERINKPPADDAQLVYEAQVRSDLDGIAYLEMWVHFGDEQYFSRSLNQPIRGRAGWTRLQTPFLLQPGQKPDRVTLNLVIQGTGTVWIDDLRVFTRPLPE